MTTLACRIPDVFSAGSTVSYRRTYEGHSATDWDLAVVLRGAGTNRADATVTKDGPAFLVTLDAAVTEDLEPGSYQWLERLTKGDIVEDGDYGRLEVTPDLTGDDPIVRTWAEITLDKIRAAIGGAADANVLSYQVYGRSLTRYPLPELQRLEADFTNRVAREKRNGARRAPIRVAFTTPGLGQ